jgi:1-acyl-sn-glycerol-3-phosphate acyltransferase
MIIRGGHNIHPQELEEAISQLAGVRKGGVAVFAAADRRRATERVVALVEVRMSGDAPRGELIARINHLAIDLIGMPIDDVVLAPPRTVLKTSSGKIRRTACKEAYEQGKLGASGRPPWVQLARLRLAALAARGSRAAWRVANVLWGVRALLVAACLAPLVWLLVLVLPGLQRRRALAAAVVRLAMRLAGVSLQIRQAAPAGGGQQMYVSNHASYLDAATLITVLPDVTFVAAGEFENSWLLGPLLRRLGCLFVERHDVQGAVAAGGAIEARLRARECLYVFAEGTFQRDPGLRPFHMGAFLAAAHAGVPVAPVAVRGTRAMLPDGSHLPRPAPLVVVIGEPVMPEGTGWDAALALRKAARGFILAHVHEPDLEQAARSTP